MADPRPLLIAHRGASAEAPENTAAAFRRALEQGADGLELDVQLSRDGVPVVFHDRTLARLGRPDTQVAELDWEELARLDAGVGFAPEFAGEPLLSLDSVVLEFGSRTRLLVEIKARPGSLDAARIPTLVAAVLDVLEARPSARSVTLLSFDAGVLDRAAEQAPELPRVCNLAPAQPREPQQPWLGYGVPTAGLSRAFAASARAAGRKLLVYTCNTRSSARHACRCGAHWILSDAPARVGALLRGPKPCRTARRAGREVLSVTLDLGSTRLKVAQLGDHGKLREISTLPSPRLRGRGPVRHSDPSAYLERTSQLLARALRRLPAGMPIGLACQRSSFLIWGSRDGAPVTPLWSWRDRQAAAWCAARQERAGEIWRRTGLPLSPHYLGPKLARLLAQQPDWHRGLAGGALLAGTLDSYLVWHWTRGQLHRTDLTMAARTLLVDPRSGHWDPWALDWFGVPRAGLAQVGPSCGFAVPLAGGGLLTASVADQAAAALAALGPEPGAVLVNLGTGIFVLRPTTGLEARPPGYLRGPLLAPSNRPPWSALEGTLNGVVRDLDHCARQVLPLPNRDPHPGAFCLPDRDGVGSPHWRAEPPRRWSGAAARLTGPARERVVVEGVLFRLREILEGLGAATAPVVVSGGAGSPGLAAALAACLGRPVQRSAQAQTTLLGAGQLAAGQLGPPAARCPVAPVGGAYLGEKYRHWRAWVEDALGAAP